MIIMNADKLTEVAKKYCKSMPKTERQPKLVILTATDDKSSLRYVENKKKLAKEYNIDVLHISFNEEVIMEDIQDKIIELNEDNTVDGIILQLPLYDKFDKDDEYILLNTVSAEKDVDGLTVISLGTLQEDDINFMPCTPFGIGNLLSTYNLLDTEGKNVVVVGRGKTSGLPMASMFRNLDANVVTLHSKTSKEDLEFYVRKADIVISCVGKRHLLKAEWFKEESIIIGVGFTYDENGKQHLDFEVDEVVKLNKAKAVTNRVNCTGKATVISLMVNTAKAYLNNIQK